METDKRARDNICAALSRMTVAHVNSVPVDQVRLKQWHTAPCYRYVYISSQCVSKVMYCTLYVRRVYLQVYPAILGCLPLQKDLDEVLTVYKCIGELYQNSCTAVSNLMP